MLNEPEEVNHTLLVGSPFPEGAWHHYRQCIEVAIVRPCAETERNARHAFFEFHPQVTDDDPALTRWIFMYESRRRMLRAAHRRREAQTNV